MSKLAKNFIYNIIYQVLILILPLISAPYISRILGAEGIGTYSYTYSIVSYFVMFAMLGINNYGNRLIAQTRDDKEKLSINFWSLYILEFIITAIVLIAYIIFITFIIKEDKLMYILQFGYILSSFFDINWFFFGIEEFKITVTRNTIIKILSFVLLFIFVKTKSDIYIYTIILVISNFISNIVLWPFIFKRIKKVKISFKDIFKHLKPCIILFIPVIAVSLYKKMDKIMLGIMSTKLEVGFYENAEKIISIPLAIITALGTVMLPRMSNIIANGDEKKFKEYISKSMEFIIFLASPIVLGLISIAKEFAPVYFGNEFYKTGYLIEISSITILFISWANVIRTQYLIPKERDKEYINSVIMGAIVNLISNLLLIPKFNSIGASIGTVLAEFTVMFIQTISIKKYLPIQEYVKNNYKFLVKAIIMFCVLYHLNFVNMNKIINMILQIGVGIIIYYILNYRYIFKLINFDKIFINRRKDDKVQ